jgi:hypothetical protein
MRAISVQALRERALDHVEDYPEAALADAREAVRRQPDAESHSVLGVALSASGETDAASAAFAAAVEEDGEVAGDGVVAGAVGEGVGGVAEAVSVDVGAGAGHAAGGGFGSVGAEGREVRQVEAAHVV